MKNKKSTKPKNRGNLIFGIIVSVFTIVLIGSLYIFKDELSSNKGKGNSSFTSGETIEINTANDPVIGDSDAPVTVVEFGDYKCPACGYFSNYIYPALKAEYIDTGKIKLVFKNFPFIATDSDRAATYGEGVYKVLGNDAFWKYHESIYAYQNEIYKDNDTSNESKDMLTEKYLKKLSTELFGSTDSKKLANILDNKGNKASVQSDLDQANTAGVSGTPTVYVNGKAVYNALSYDIIKGAIDEALNGDSE